MLRPGGWSLFPARQSGHRLHQSGRGGRGRALGAESRAGGLGPEVGLGAWGRSWGWSWGWPLAGSVWRCPSAILWKAHLSSVQPVTVTLGLTYLEFAVQSCLPPSADGAVPARLAAPQSCSIS